MTLRRRRRIAAAAWTVGALVVTAAGVWTYGRMGDSGTCAALSAMVVDAPSIEHESGQGATAPHWSTVLTLGVDHIAAHVQPGLAVAVADDGEGYADVRRALPEASRPVADRQRARVIDPEPAAARRADPEVGADSLHLSRIAYRGCNAV